MFLLPDNILYFCGHSLGPITQAAKQAINNTQIKWLNSIVNAWEEWLTLPTLLGTKIAPLIGAKKHEVIVSDSTSINLMKLLLAAMQLSPHRNIILTERDNFPADLYMAQTLANLNKNISVKSVDASEIIESLDNNIAVLLLTHVNFKTSAMYNMKDITRKAHEKGILVLWDLSHSVGAMDLYCSEYHIDFAVGATYKYLNGGPGSPAFLYINEKHHDNLKPVIYGWIGHAAPFDFSSDYIPASGVTAYQIGTPSILSMKALEGALEIFNNIDLKLLREKSIALSAFLIEQIQSKIPEFILASPTDPKLRGSHVAFTHPHARELVKVLNEQGVIVDFRAPNLIRFGITPLYVNKKHIEKVVSIIFQVNQNNSYQGIYTNGNCA